MKFILLLILTVLLVNGDLDICETQKICRLECANMEYPSKVYTLEKMTPEIQNIILSRLNEFRNDVALGIKYSAYLPAAANMRMMKWNKEFEYYSEEHIRGYDTCTPYEILTHGWQSGYYNFNGGFVLENSLNSALQLIFDMTFEAPNRISWSMTKNIIANNTEIGCAYGKYIDRLNKVSLAIRCTTASVSGTRVENLYEVGEPCSKCSSWNETCSAQFKGLCVSTEN